jgi:CBS domain-containing protein
MVKNKIIGDWMKKSVFSIHPSATVKEAAALMLEKRIGTLPVIDEERVLIGITTMQNILNCFLPDFISMLSNVDFIKDFGALKTPSTGSLVEIGKLTVAEIMEEPVSIEANSGLMRALSVIHKRNLQDLPVTQEGKLVGLASRVDIGRGFLASWQKE